MKLDKIENIIVAPLYIIILMVTIPVLSETIYTPSLPDLAKDLAISANLAEYTLTIYLFGFAIGVLIWGNLSDCYGRKPCVLTGFLIYALSCFICYLADNINMLFAARFIQAFGASVGSVLGIAIARDVVKPAERGKMFSTIAIATAFSPDIGPVRTPSQSEGLDGYEQPKGLPLLIKILLIRQSLNYQVALDS